MLSDEQELAFHDICNRLDYLSDKGLSNLILVIRELQVERETETILAEVVS